MRRGLWTVGPEANLFSIMKSVPIKLPIGIAVLSALLTSASLSYGALANWQSEVNSSGAAATHYSTVNGSAPIIVDVGTLSGDRSFEFVVNAGSNGRSQGLLGNNGANGNQGLKYEQWDNTELFGLTVFGVTDLNSTARPTFNSDMLVSFVSDGVSGTDLYVNGALAHTFATYPLALTGMQGLGGIVTSTGTFIDNLDGNILGFASWDRALSAAEVSAHNLALVPEPSTIALFSLGGVGLLIGAVRRRRR
jgi:hypothetical protein